MPFTSFQFFPNVGADLSSSNAKSEKFALFTTSERSSNISCGAASGTPEVPVLGPLMNKWLCTSNRMCNFAIIENERQEIMNHFTVRGWTFRARKKPCGIDVPSIVYRK